MYLVLDAETGGIDPKTSLLQLYAAVYNDKLEYTDHIELKIKPNDGNYLVTAGALKVNRINIVEHDKIAMVENEAKVQLSQFLVEKTKGGKEKLTVVGWNVHFDLGFIYEHLLKKENWEQFVSYRVMDLQPVGYALKTVGRVPKELGNLGSYAKHFGMDIEGAHEARKDVELTVGVFKNMLKLLEVKEIASN